MTEAEWKETGIEIQGSVLFLEAGLEWIKENTTLEIEYSMESVEALPIQAKLFLMEYSEIMQRAAGITSESIPGMSQSFQEAGKDELIMKSAKCLLSKYLKPALTILPARRRWL